MEEIRVSSMSFQPTSAFRQAASKANTLRLFSSVSAQRSHATSMTIYSRILMTALLVTSLGCSPRSDADATPAPRVTVDAPRVGLRCALASVYYHFNAGGRGDKLPASVLASPDGKLMAFMDPRGVRLFDLASDSETLVEGVRPVLWSRDSSRLYLIDTNLHFFSFKSGKVSGDPWLDKIFRDALAGGQTFSRPDLFVAGNGLIAVPRAAARILVANLEDKTTFSVLVGGRWLSPRPYSDIRIGWNAVRNEPALFVVHQALKGTAAGANPHETTVSNRIDVYGPRGAHEFGAELTGQDVVALPLLLEQGAVVLSRAGEFRCANVLSTDGKVSTWRPCSQDIETLALDRQGELIAAKTYLELEPHNELKLREHSSDFTGARLLASLADGSSLHLARTAAGGDELISVRSGVVQRRRSLPSHECVDRDAFPRGTPLSPRSKDGFEAHGFLFTPPPAIPVRGLLVHLHGGPREAHPDLLLNVFSRAMLERGYAVVAVNYRGSSGYGRTLLEKPYGGGYDGMLDDAAALRNAAAAELHLPPGAPVVLRGVSFGGYLAMKAAAERPRDYGTFIIESGVCHMASSGSDVSYGSSTALPLNRVTDPDYSLHGLLIATDSEGKVVAPDLCGARAGDTARVVVIHADGDPEAPFARMRSYAEAQDKDRLLTMFANGMATHNPLMEFAADKKNFDAIVDRAMQFIEAPLATAVAR
jgi:pimeloyl-ACP methyl ester carboxylesterase